MNWQRIKTILIVALVGINMLLGYFLYERSHKKKVEFIDSALVVDLLENRKIQVPPKLFEVNQPRSNISLKIQSYDVSKYKALFEKASLFEEIENVRLETLFEQNKAIHFKTYGGMLDPVTLSEDDILKTGNEMIEALGFYSEEVFLKSIGRTHEKTILTFGQKIDGFVLRDSEMILKYNNNNLLEFYRLWYDVVESTDVSTDFYEPEYAIYEFVGELYERFPNRQRSVTVETFDMVYQLSPDDVPDIDNSALEGEASISYRVVTSDGIVYLIQAVVD